MTRALFRKDISGQKFGRLTVQSFSHTDAHRRATWVCLCDCGKTALVAGISLRNGHTASCGCLFDERAELGTLRHGYSNTPVWNAWVRMRSRCDKTSMDRFENYGGRGISYCDRWSVFENFLEDMGEPPEAGTLERKNVNDNYTKENCEWISADAQYSNKTTTLWVEFQGKRHSFRDLVKASGLKYDTAYARFKTYGWPIERVFAQIKPASLHDHGKSPDTQQRPDSQSNADHHPDK